MNHPREQVMVKIGSSQGDHGIGEVMTESVLSAHRLQIMSRILDRDDHYYRIQSERSRILAEKETIEKVYQVLLEDNRVLQTNFDDVVSEKDDALARLRQMQRDLESRRNDKADVMMRAEIDRLRSEL